MVIRKVGMWDLIVQPTFIIFTQYDKKYKHNQKLKDTRWYKNKKINLNKWNEESIIKGENMVKNLMHWIFSTYGLNNKESLN